MKRFVNQTFRDQQVRLDSGTYENCLFENCLIIFSGLGEPSLTSCDFRNTQWALEDAAVDTLEFLRVLYRSGEGGRRVVQPFLDRITDGFEPPKVLPGALSLNVIRNGHRTRLP